MSDEKPSTSVGSGNPALDLVNTRRLQHGTVLDELRAPGDLLVWLRRRGLSSGTPGGSAPPTPPVARTLLQEAHRLRADLEHLLNAHARGAVPASHVLYAVNRILGQSRTSVCLRVDADGASLIESERGEHPLAALAPIARAASELVLTTAPARVRRCAANECSRWFVDTSKGGRRKWCSMATCGNRAKAAKHRRRTATA